MSLCFPAPTLMRSPNATVGEAATTLGHLLPHRLHILNRHGIGRGVDALRSALVVGINHVRADGLQLAQNVLLARQADRGHQNHRSRAYSHGQRREHELKLVAAEGVVSEVQDFVEPDREAALSVKGRRVAFAIASD